MLGWRDPISLLLTPNKICRNVNHHSVKILLVPARQTYTEPGLLDHQ